ncbi:MAG: S8 family serine peptidase [Pseudomonadota bacterium]
MISRATTGRIMAKLRATPVHLPAHHDVVEGAARAMNSLDGGGSLDASVHDQVSGMRCSRVFGARKSVNRAGERAQGFDTLEIDMGLDRVVALELSNREAAQTVARRLAHDPGVEWAMPEPLAHAPLLAAAEPAVTLPDPEIVAEPHHRVRASQALAIEPGSADIRVAVIDTGMALEHPEFDGRIHGGLDTVDLGMGTLASGIELVGDSKGRDFCARDETGHGSHVAGIIGARGLGIMPGIGGAAGLIPVRALAAARGAGGRVVGIGGTIDIDAAIKTAVDFGARVLNLSLGTSEHDVMEGLPAVHGDSIAYAQAQGAICVAAMGNSGKEERYFPAVLPGVIAVGAMEATGYRARFSTLGDHVTLCAPGTDVISAGLRGYKPSTGTSHAAPFVSGTVALMLSLADRHGARLSAHTITSILTSTAAPGKSPTREIGAGCLDAGAALAATRDLLQQKGGGADADTPKS